MGITFCFGRFARFNQSSTRRGERYLQVSEADKRLWEIPACLDNIRKKCCAYFPPSDSKDPWLIIVCNPAHTQHTVCLPGIPLIQTLPGFYLCLCLKNRWRLLSIISKKTTLEGVFKLRYMLCDLDVIFYCFSSLKNIFFRVNDSYKTSR